MFRLLLREPLARTLAALGYRVEVVEIDPGVVMAAEQYFGFPRGPVAVHIDDARAFLTDCAKRDVHYDTLVLDVCAGGTQPEHLATVEAYETMKAVLGADGLVIANVLGYPNDNDGILGHQICTMQKVFSNVALRRVGPVDGHELQNVLLLAGPSGLQERGDWELVGDQELSIVTDDWSPMPLLSVRVNRDWHENVARWLGSSAIMPW